MPKPKPVGRPKLPKEHAKSSIIPVRFNTEDRKRVEAAAKASKQSVSKWTRSMLVDFKMSAEDWNKVMALFGKARDGYSRLGNGGMAKKCDDAIGLVQLIALDPHLQGW